MGMMALAISLTGCVRLEEDDLFDESAALRIEHTGDDVQRLLVNAPYGWVMQYHTGTGVSVFEGFNLFAKFEQSGKVTLAGNHKYLRDGNANKYTEASSLYQLIREDGLVLAFNTWNDVLTPFVDPVAPYAAPDNLLKDGAGMQGDQNLVITSYNDKEVIMRGERYGAEVRLVKADRAWADYIADTESMKNSITNSTITSYYLTAGGRDTLYYVGLRGGKYRKSDRVNDPLRVDSISCCFTPNGFRNEHSDEVSGHRFQEFTLSEDKSCLVNEDGTVKVIPMWDTYIVTRTTLWKLDPEAFTEEQQQLYAQMDEAFKVYNKNASIASVGLGRSSGGGAVNGLVVTFYTNAKKTQSNTCGLSMTFTRPRFGEINIDSSEASTIDNNLKSIGGRSAELEPLVRKFAATLNGTYTMVPNDYFLPTGAVFTSVSDATKLVLSK